MEPLKDLKYAILPWMEQITAGRIISVAAILLAAWCLFEAIFRRYNKSMRRGTLALISNTVWPLLVNLCIFCVAYWQWAFVLAAVVGLIFISVLRHELKEAYIDELGCELIYVSAATGQNLDELVQMVAERLRLLPPLTIYDADFDAAEGAVAASGERKTEIKVEDGVYVVEGEWLYNLLGQINFSDYESLAFFQRVLQKGGVIDALEKEGATDGDTVRIYNFEFDFVK